MVQSTVNAPVIRHRTVNHAVSAIGLALHVAKCCPALLSKPECPTKECTSDQALHQQGICAWAITRFGTALDHASIWLSDEDSANVVDYGMLAMEVYMDLATQALVSCRARYRVRPKLHSFVCEIIQRLEAGMRLNPRFTSCAGDEDYIGKVASILKGKSHPTTACRRALERLLLGINVWLMEVKGDPKTNSMPPENG